MGFDQAIVVHTNAVLLALTVGGLLLNRRHTLCRSFLFYCCACLATNRLVTHWPDTFFTPWFWSSKEAAYAALSLMIAVEVGLVAFSQFPRARLHVLVAALIVAGMGVLALLWPHEAGDPYWEMLSVFTPRGQAALAAVFATVVLVAVRYRIPLHPFHRGILVGFAFYLAVSTFALSLVYERGWLAYPVCLAIDRFSYAVTVGIWAWAAWRPAPDMTPIRARLQPWAVHSC